MYKISVVIPTHNRCSILVSALKSFENQTISKEDYEVIIVNNGSADCTEKEIEVFKNKSLLDVRYFKIEQPSASKARNLGILNARYNLILNTDDDIIATENLLEEHIKFHKNFNSNGSIAVLGYTTWHNSLRVTNFMRFINEYGPQFGYSLIKDETDLPFNYFYSSNVSIPKRFLLKNEIFDEDFPEYWYDTELGYRLKQKGLRIMLNKNAIAYHLHPTSIFSFLKRQYKVGKFANLLYLKHPELKYLLFPSVICIDKLNAPIRKSDLFRLNLSLKFYNLLIKFCYSKGFKSGVKSLSIFNPHLF